MQPSEIIRGLFILRREIGKLATGGFNNGGVAHILVLALKAQVPSWWDTHQKTLRLPPLPQGALPFAF